MSGHSKWSSIKHKKGAADAKRGKLFTQMGRAITIAARTGGGDPSFNFSLRMAIAKAKTGNVPKDNIEKAIKRGTGELEGARIEEKRYEGYGPQGVAVIVDALTDNSNRTVADLKHLFSKHGGNLGGSVAWLFESKGVIIVPDQASKADNDDLLLEALDYGIEDFQKADEDLIVITGPKDLQKAQEWLEKQKLKVESADLQMLPKETIPLDDEQKEQLEKFLEIIDESDDVDKIFHNGEV